MNANDFRVGQLVSAGAGAMIDLCSAYSHHTVHRGPGVGEGWVPSCR